ncbi:MAG: archaeosine biosynthesis radical SAM protein RaSEA [Promethearchaeota archaeon]
MKESNEMVNPLVDKIYFLRNKALKNRKSISLDQLKKPVSFWIKEDRLQNEIGKEFTIILRTNGCSWALSREGGCSMCGYIQDASIQKVNDEIILTQFNHALQNKIKEIEQDDCNYILKIFNSGSFFDDSEINKVARKEIYSKIIEIDEIKEVVIESRIDYITIEKLEEIKDSLRGKHVEIGIGLESANDHIRNQYINKGLLLRDFENIIEMCKQYGVGIKAYLLFKPLFLNEQSAIDDCASSIRYCLDIGINTISINPINIQRGSLVEYLWYQNRYRPPWFYSLFNCLQNTISNKDLKECRIVSDPSGAGTKRGIHNCLKRDCNKNMTEMLKNFVLKQDINELDIINHKCECKKLYDYQKHFY